jgi:hypothetical protein
MNTFKSRIHDERMKTKKGHAYTRYNSRKHYAKKKGIIFDVSLDYVVSLITDKCPILGIDLSWCEQNGQVAENSPSLDRIIPSLGYIEGNIVWISTRANRIKNNGTQEEHYKIAEFMERHSAL